MVADGEWRVGMETKKEAVESRVHILEVDLRGSSVGLMRKKRVGGRVASYKGGGTFLCPVHCRVVSGICMCSSTLCHLNQ